PLAASAVNVLVSAASSGAERNTEGAAPVTATRALPSAACATKTPTSAKRDAGFGNFTYAAFFGIGNDTAVMISSGLSAVSYIPLKKSPAASRRLLVTTV